MVSCPNTRLKVWKDLVQNVGENKAYLLWAEHEGNVPNEFYSAQTTTVGGDNVIELGEIENKAGQNISELLSEMLTAYVDIAKDPYILDINAIQSTANTILMMLRWGVKPNLIFKFMNQPIILDYVKEQQFNESIVNEGTEDKLPKFSNERKTGVVNKVMEKYNSSIKNENLLSWNQEQFENTEGKEGKVMPNNTYAPITEKELNEGIEKNKQNATQIKYLDLFLEYQRQSKLFQEMIRSTSPDTQSFKNFSTLESQVLLRDKVAESGMFINYDKMFDGFIGRYYNSKKDFVDTVKPLYISQMPEYKDAIDKLKDLYVSVASTPAEKERAIDRIENGLYQYAIAQSIVDFKEAHNVLFRGDKSIPKILKRLKEDFAKEGVENDFVEFMLPLINTTKEGFDNIKPFNRKSTLFEEETKVAYFKKLKRYENIIKEKYGVPRFFDRLMLFSIIQTGIDNNPYSFAKFIPALEHYDYVKDSIINARDGGLDINDFTDQYIKNNLKALFNKFTDKKDFMVKIVNGRAVGVPKQGLPFAQLGNTPYFNIYHKVARQINEKIDESEYNSNEPDNPLNKC